MRVNIHDRQSVESIVKTIFCPECGTAGQTPESYCRSCGVWLPHLGSPGKLIRSPAASREDKLVRIRTLEIISAGLSITAGAIVFTYLFTGADRGLLFLAAAVSFVVAIYQIANMVLGHGVAKSLPVPPEIQRQIDPAPDLKLPAQRTNELAAPASVTEHTTRQLDPVSNKSKQ